MNQEELFEVVCTHPDLSTQGCRSQLLYLDEVDEVFSLHEVRVGAHPMSVDSSLRAIVEWWLRLDLRLVRLELPLS